MPLPLRLFAALLLCLSAGLAHAEGDVDRDARTRAKYRLGDEADEAAQHKAALAHRADFSTPKGALEAWRAASIRGSRGDFLECLAPALRARKYPRGAEDRIKYVDSLKYRLLVMYAKVGEPEVDGDTAHVNMHVRFRRASGNLRSQFLRFTLQRMDGAWRLMDLGRKVRRGK